MMSTRVLELLEITTMIKANKGKGMFGKTHSKEARKKMSEKHKEALRTGKRNTHRSGGHPNAGVREDLDQFFYNNWEANVARILNHKGIRWEYEPQRFDLGKYTYLPDFYLPEIDQWIEVKGWIRDGHKERVIYQLKEFSKDHKLMIIDIPAYKKLEKKYKYLIPEWETGKSTNIIHRVRSYIRCKRSKYPSFNITQLLE